MSEEGKKLGLIDAIVPSTELLKVARLWAPDIAERRKPWMCSLHRTDKIGSISEAREVLKLARQQMKQTARNMPQHLACFDVIEEGIVHGGYNGVLKMEYLSISSLETSQLIMGEFFNIWKETLEGRSLPGHFVHVEPDFQEYGLSNQYTSQHTAVQYAEILAQMIATSQSSQAA